jgi:hypothetical protein
MSVCKDAFKPFLITAVIVTAVTNMMKLIAMVVYIAYIFASWWLGTLGAPGSLGPHKLLWRQRLYEVLWMHFLRLWLFNSNYTTRTEAGELGACAWQAMLVCYQDVLCNRSRKIRWTSVSCRPFLQLLCWVYAGKPFKCHHHGNSGIIVCLQNASVHVCNMHINNVLCHHDRNVSQNQ